MWLIVHDLEHYDAHYLSSPSLGHHGHEQHCLKSRDGANFISYHEVYLVGDVLLQLLSWLYLVLQNDEGKRHLAFQIVFQTHDS